MSDIGASLIVLAGLIGIYLLLFRSMRGTAGPARSLAGLENYGESAWGVALLSGFAVGDILRALGAWGQTPDALGQAATLAVILTIVVGWSCGFGAGRSVLVTLPAALVGAFAAILKSIDTVREAAASGDWTLVAMVVGVGILFGFLLVARFLISPRAMAGLAWYAALEVVLLLAGPFGASLGDLDVGGVVVLPLLQIGIPIALALMPSVVLNLFACGVVLAEFYLAFLGYGGDFLTTAAYAITALVGYLIGAWMRRGFGAR